MAMVIRDLPELHPDAIGVTINGQHFTREEYEPLRIASLTPEGLAVVSVPSDAPSITLDMHIEEIDG